MKTQFGNLPRSHQTQYIQLHEKHEVGCMFSSQMIQVIFIKVL